MDFQRLQFAAYLRDEALKRIGEESRRMLGGPAAEYREENLIRIAIEIFEEVDGIADAMDANANDRHARSWTEKLD